MTLLTLRPSASPAPESGGGPVELLLACHERIRRFAALAVRLASTPNASPDAVADAAREVMRYFSVALPLHVLDEDQSIAPRLGARAVPSPVRDAVREATAQHARIDELLAAMLPEWHRLEARAPAPMAWLAEASVRLEQLFDAHLALEEQYIFPALPEVLDPGERDAIAGEIRARRASPAPTR